MVRGIWCKSFRLGVGGRDRERERGGGGGILWLEESGVSLSD